MLRNWMTLNISTLRRPKKWWTILLAAGIHSRRPWTPLCAWRKVVTYQTISNKFQALRRPSPWKWSSQSWRTVARLGSIQIQLCSSLVYGVIFFFPPLTEVNIKISHHTLADESITLEKPLVFILDEPKEEEKKSKKKSKKDSAPNHKNFGAKLAVNAMKGSDKFMIGWRCRHLA